MHSEDPIYVAGHRWLVGSAIVRALERAGYCNLIGRTHAELNLRSQQGTDDSFANSVRNTFSWWRRKWVGF